jgi:hypothetical protein
MNLAVMLIVIVERGYNSFVQGRPQAPAPTTPPVMVETTIWASDPVLPVLRSLPAHFTVTNVGDITFLIGMANLGRVDTIIIHTHLLVLELNRYLIVFPRHTRRAAVVVIT